MRKITKEKIINYIPSDSPIIDYFNKNTLKDCNFGPNGDCWKWLRSVDSSGYGVVPLRCFKKRISAHKLSYSLFKNKGNIVYEKEERVLHKCDTPLCVNPEHLWLGTQIENIYDMCKKKRQYKPIGNLNPKCKLNEKQVIEIFKSKETTKSLMKKYKISSSSICSIRRGKTWSHLTQGLQ